MNIGALELGIRVVRGANWQWGDQDGGEGNVGTVVEIGKPPGTQSTPNKHYVDKTPDKTVIVQWDNGSRSNYRIGYQDNYDLLIFDNAAAGVRHPHIICDVCKTQGIPGMRWKCSQCFDFDLCTQCYMADKHDMNHAFQRFLTGNSVGVQLTSRENCTKIVSKGIFVGAKVARGPDWEWANQDGGKGNTGKVMDIRGWDMESSRSVATVTWPSGNTNVYRLGYKGLVDLCYVESTSGGTYYKEHLPLLEQIPPITTVNECNTSNARRVTDPKSASQTTFVVGDRAKVLIDIETLKRMQTGHGGWNPRMADYIGKIGTVHRITDKGDIRVQYDNCTNRWTFHPGALTKVNEKKNFALGDIVKVKSDVHAVKFYQKGHGEWIDAMKPTLGKTGKVIKIYPDGDMRVQLDGHTWTFNPLSVQKVSAVGSEAFNSLSEGSRGLAPEKRDLEVERLLREAARGKAGIPTVKEFLRKYPSRVDARGGPGSGRKTCLQVAAHQGQRELCILLLDAGASLSAIDEDGDTPLHYAAFGNQPADIELLLARGAAIDAVNNGKCSALHVAVNKQHLECVKTLIRHGCNVNLQDSYGDTTLHDAIGKDSTEIIDALCSCERLDLTLRNKRGFNVLHHAALKGNAYAMERLVQRAQSLVDVKKEDGFAALHLSSLNGHREVALKLLRAGRARPDVKNNRQQTPLHLATSQGHWSLIELLVGHGADVASIDEDGDTPVHIAIYKRRNQSVAPPSSARDSPLIHAIYQDLSSRGAKTELSLACFLVSNDTTGTILEVRNSKDKTPLDLLQDEPEGSAPLSPSQTDSDLALSVEVIRSYQGLRRQPNRPATSSNIEPAATHQFELLSLTDVSNDASREPMRAGGICNTCNEHSDCAGSEENRLGPGGDVSCSCTRCGCGPAHDVKSNQQELDDDAERKNNDYLDKNREEKLDKEKDKDLERLRYLETRIADLEEANMCSICMEHRRNIAFLCGHGACERCAAPLKTCHMCRQTITKKINLY